MNELQIVVEQKQGVISTNFEDIKKELSAQMQVYKELEVTETNKPERKRDIATLRKMAKAVNEKKTEVRNEFMRPYTSFENNVKELIEIIQEPVTIIDNQVKEFEDKQRKNKILEIKESFEDMIANYPKLIDDIGIAEIYDDRWESATATMKSVKEEMTAKLDEINTGVIVISSMVSDKTKEALEGYLVDFDLARAVASINSFEEYKKKIIAQQEEKQRKDKEAEEERQRLAREREVERIKENAIREARAEVLKEEQAKAEIERIKAEAEQKAREEEETKTMAKEQAEREAMSAKKSMGGTEMITYKIIATPEEFGMVEMYLNSIGVEFLKGEF